MNPWEKGSVDGYWHDEAVISLDNGKLFRNSILLIGVTPGDSTPLGQMLFHKEQNYETAGFISFNSITNPTSITSFSAAENLSNAIATFAYEIYLGTPEAENNLREAIKTLSSIYLMIGDEFLIDVLEWRFSSTTLGVEAKLDEQILLLRKAQLCYEKAVGIFVHGFSPAVGTSVYVSESFDSAVFNLFNLAIERSSLAMQERSAKELARQISPTSVSATMELSKEQMKNSYSNIYLLTAATAQKQADEFLNNGGARLSNALKSLQAQSRIYSSNLNPLGYDDRYVPMQDFSTLHSKALTSCELAIDSNDKFISEDRLFDSQVATLQTVHNSIATNDYRVRLSSLTGISVSSISPATIDQVIAAGEDLYDCEIDNKNFSTCMVGKTGGVLGSKYKEIRNAQFRVDLALLRRSQYLEKIEMENNRYNKSLQIENKYNAAYKESVESFYERLKGARSIERVITKTKGNKDKEIRTTTSYSIEDPALGISTDKETSLQELMNDYKISNMQTSHEVDLMNLFHSLAEIEIEIGLSVQIKNSAGDDFDNALKERDNLVFLYQKSNEYYYASEEEIKNKITETRILRSEAALGLARDLNNAVRMSYLAAKAYEYKYLTPLINISMDGGSSYLNISDLYKIQTPGDLKLFLTQIKSYDTCSWGSVAPQLYRISLAKDILGLNDLYLESLGAITYAEKSRKKYELVQQFLNNKIDQGTNNLEFPFSISLTDIAVSQYGRSNMKIWWGHEDQPCDPVEAKGVSVLISTTQSAFLDPFVTLTLAGAQSFLNKTRKIVEYVPVSNYLNMQVIDNDTSIVTKGSFDAFVNTDPRLADITSRGWSSSFKGRSLASSNWSVLIQNFSYPAIDWNKVTDITFYFDTMTRQ